MDVSEPQAPPNGNPRPHVNADPKMAAFEIALERAVERAIMKAMGNSAGGFLAPIRFKRPNPNTGVPEDITTCVAQQLENLCIVLSATVRGLAETSQRQQQIVEMMDNLGGGMSALIEAINENTDASDPDEDDEPRRKKK